MRYQRLPTQGPCRVQHEIAMAFYSLSSQTQFHPTQYVLQLHLIVVYLLPKMQICCVTLLLKNLLWLPFALGTTSVTCSLCLPLQLCLLHTLCPRQSKSLASPPDTHTVCHLYALRYISCAYNAQCFLNCLVIRIT